MLWHGDLEPVAVRDRVELELQRDGEGALYAAPIALSTPSHTLQLRDHTGRVATGGLLVWGITLLLVGMGLGRRRR